MIIEVTTLCGSGIRDVDGRSRPIKRDVPAARFKLRGRRLRAVLAAEERQPRGATFADPNLYLCVTKITHYDCALSRLVSSFDSNPSLVLVEIDRGEIFAAVRQTLVTFSERQQIAMELQHLPMRRLRQLLPIQLRSVERFLRLRIDESFIEKSRVFL